MSKFQSAIILALAWTVLAAPVLAFPANEVKSSTAAKQQTLSTRVVDYQLDAKLDVAKKTITASEVLTYHNLTGQPQQTFPFHLYLNAFQPHSTFFEEAERQDAGVSWTPENYGSITIERLTVVGMGDFTDRMQFIHPDDNNAADRTVVQVVLPKPVSPGADIQFIIQFTDKLPRVVERTGYLRDFFMVGQWFPKVGVWWKGAWNCHQFHFSTEFFADFGTFDAKLTVPQNEVVGAVGDLISTVNNPDGTKTLEFRAEDVHDFAWTASPSFQLVEDSWTGSAGPLRIHMLLSPGNASSSSRYLAALKGSLKLFDQWIGPYPYGQITLVDPPHGGFRAGGMEYPTLFTAGTIWYMPRGILLPEIVVAHEFGHEYFYGMVATNEFEEAWLDEGINSFMEAKVMDALYGKDSSILNFPFATLGEVEDHRVGLLSSGYLHLPDTDPLSRLGWQFFDDRAYGSVNYGKAVLVLTTLEKIIGEETLREALHIYFLRFRFMHPTHQDFLKTVEEVSGRDLHWYFNQAVYGTNLLDYEILDARSEPVPSGDVGKGPSGKNSSLFRTFVAVHRKGDFIFPVDLKTVFSDGTAVVEHWDGQDRWIRYQYDRPAELVSTEIDPEHQVPLDLNLYNNSYVAREDRRAVQKLANIWTFIAEWLGQLIAWIT